MPIQVLLITGAPGSGKTLLLNRLLAELPPGSVPAVITHRLAREFGLDAHPVRETGDMFRAEMFDFGSGCVCCSPTGDLLKHLLAVRAALSPAEPPTDGAAPPGPPPSIVLVETTGLADPAVFVQLLHTHAELRAAFELCALVCVVDAEATPALLNSGLAAVALRTGNQVRSADVVVLANCTSDQARRSASAAIARALASAAPSPDGTPTPIVVADALRWPALLALGSARSALLRGEGDVACVLPVAGPVILGGRGGHDGTFDSVCLVEEGVVHEAHLQNLLAITLQLASAAGSVLLRIKGVISVACALEGQRPAGSVQSDGDRVQSDGHPDVGVELVVCEWSAGSAQVRTRPLDPSLSGPERVPARPLAHTMVAGMDVGRGSCKLLFVGHRVPVNSLRAALWQAMRPPGYALAAEIELDFPAAHLHAERASQRQALPAGAVEVIAQEGVGPLWAVRRLADWLGQGRDVLLFWVEGAFVALADFEAVDPLRWELERSILSHAGGVYLVSPAPPLPHGPAEHLAVDIATGKQARLPSELYTCGDRAVLRRLEMRILGGTVYVEHADS
ncbi:CobW/HypB/UreG, nucleotide-binding domain-containing protein [Pavlovales sp. CCMP2436]|nr:CobW/HypB/UreG, nucleotide-binding domain-containing protein [Pavlovales sp. CCMP2436]|mmetsp:Transcript_14909/g.37778  ORF Transcript_14909/g.37778 Transcript_14909/m.37778 type:complete len:566 (-) Transcript_14909:92-1789(-)